MNQSLYQRNLTETGSYAFEIVSRRDETGREIPTNVIKINFIRPENSAPQIAQHLNPNFNNEINLTAGNGEIDILDQLKNNSAQTSPEASNFTQEISPQTATLNQPELNPETPAVFTTSQPGLIGENNHPKIVLPEIQTEEQRYQKILSKIKAQQTTSRPITDARQAEAGRAFFQRNNTNQAISPARAINRENETLSTKRAIHARGLRKPFRHYTEIIRKNGAGFIELNQRRNQSRDLYQRRETAVDQNLGFLKVA